MQMLEVKKELSVLKMHIDQMESWCHQAMNMIYAIEENIMDIEDADLERSIRSKSTATGIYDPPRTDSSRCSKNNTAAVCFLTIENLIKEITTNKR